MIEERVRHLVELTMRHGNLFKAGQPAAITDIEVIERGAQRPESAAAGGLEFRGRQLADRVIEPPVSPPVIARQPREIRFHPRHISQFCPRTSKRRPSALQSIPLAWPAQFDAPICSGFWRLTRCNGEFGP